MKEKIIADLRALTEDKKTLILAGHFPLISIGHKSVAGVYQDLEEHPAEYTQVKNHLYMGDFPLETFKAGVSLLYANDKSKILLLVNDHQFIEKNSNSEDQPNEYREWFYLQNQLPSSYTAVLRNAERSLIDSIWITPTTTGITYNESLYVSEQILRNRFASRSEYKDCPLKGGCAQEFVPLFQEVAKTDFEVMVNFVPSICNQPTIDATRFFKKHSNTTLHIINVFLDGSLEKGEMWKQALVDAITGK